MAMENGPIEDVFPIEHGDIPACYVSLLEASWYFPMFSRYVFQLQTSDSFSLGLLKIESLPYIM